MAFEIPKTAYSGAIKEIKLGKGDKAITVGGETAYPFYLFEGKMPNLPRIAMEVWDCPPEDWAEAALEPFQGVTDDPVAWAKKVFFIPFSMMREKKCRAQSLSSLLYPIKLSSVIITLLWGICSNSWTTSSRPRRLNRLPLKAVTEQNAQFIGQPREVWILPQV